MDENKISVNTDDIRDKACSAVRDSKVSLDDAGTYLSKISVPIDFCYCFKIYSIKNEISNISARLGKLDKKLIEVAERFEGAEKNPGIIPDFVDNIFNKIDDLMTLEVYAAVKGDQINDTEMIENDYNIEEKNEIINNKLEDRSKKLIELSKKIESTDKNSKVTIDFAGNILSKIEDVITLGEMIGKGYVIEENDGKTTVNYKNGDIEEYTIDKEGIRKGIYRHNNVPPQYTLTYEIKDGIEKGTINYTRSGEIDEYTIDKEGIVIGTVTYYNGDIREYEIKDGIEKGRYKRANGDIEKYERKNEIEIGRRACPNSSINEYKMNDGIISNKLDEINKKLIEIEEKFEGTNQDSEIILDFTGNILNKIKDSITSDVYGAAKEDKINNTEMIENGYNIEKEGIISTKLEEINKKLIEIAEKIKGTDKNPEIILDFAGNIFNKTIDVITLTESVDNNYNIEEKEGIISNKLEEINKLSEIVGKFEGTDKNPGVILDFAGNIFNDVITLEEMIGKDYIIEKNDEKTTVKYKNGDIEEYTIDKEGIKTGIYHHNGVPPYIINYEINNGIEKGTKNYIRSGDIEEYTIDKEGIVIGTVTYYNGDIREYEIKNGIEKGRYKRVNGDIEEYEKKVE